MSRRFVPVMLGINAVLAAVLGAMWLGPEGMLRHTRWTAPEPQSPNLDDAANAALEAHPALRQTFPEINARPLIAVDRRPAPETNSDGAPAEATPIALDSVVLTGIVSGPRLTGVLAQVEGAARFLKPGDSVGDWQLDRIAGHDARFVRAGETRTLTLKPSYIEGGESTAAAAPEVRQAAAPASAATTPTPPAGTGTASARPARAQPAPGPMVGTPEPNQSPRRRSQSQLEGNVTFGGGVPRRPPSREAK